MVFNLMFGIGLGELILILIVALIFISPEKLPEVAKTAAKTMRDLRRTGNEFKRSISEVDITKADSAPADDKKPLAGNDRPEARPKDSATTTDENKNTTRS